MKKLFILASLFTSLFAGQAFAQTATCDALNETSKAAAQASMNAIHSYGCCTESVSECLKKADKSCKTPEFLANEICRLTSKNKKPDEIQKNIANRANTMDKTKPASVIQFRPEQVWGNPESKVILSVYLCGRCPYCSRHIPKLIRVLENSPLKDKIALNLRYFPIKSHDNATPAALGIEAAAQLGQAWPYLIKSYDNFDAFTVAKITEWGKDLGMDADKMNQLMKDPKVRKTVADSKKEGLINGVTTTPTFFLNGRKIDGGFDDEAIISMLEEVLSETP